MSFIQKENDINSKYFSLTLDSGACVVIVSAQLRFSDTWRRLRFLAQLNKAQF